MPVRDALLLMALLLIASPGAMAFPAWSAWRSCRRLTSVIPSMTCDQLARAKKLPRWVAITGQTTALLESPRSGTACVWYQVEYAHSPSGDDSVTRRVEFHPGAELVTVTGGSATIFLAPDLARTTLAGPSIATITASGHDGDVAWQEVVIPPGVEVLAIGRPARSRDVGPLRTVIAERGPRWLPDVSFPMGTPHRPSPQQDGIVLQSGWRAVQGVTTWTPQQIRRRYALRRKRTLALLLGLPVLGLALMGLLTA
jgi:hypothetical protein